MAVYTGNTVRKLLQAEYVQADAVSGTHAMACKTQADDSNNVSGCELSCTGIYVFNQLISTYFLQP